VILLDDEGHDCADLASVRTQALATSGAILKELSGSAEFWSGEGWTMWVTDEPNGKGKTILALEFRSMPAIDIADGEYRGARAKSDSG